MELLERMSPYARVASWAVWTTDADGTLVAAPFPVEDARTAARADAMIVSLNPGSDREYETEDTTPPWSNFHSPLAVHNDVFLAEAFVDTDLWGAYMADLHPSIAESDSRLVRSKPAGIRLAVESLIEQANLLGHVRRIVCVGGMSYNSLTRESLLIERELGIERGDIQKMTHYSTAAAGAHGRDVNRYRALVQAELGLSTQ